VDPLSVEAGPPVLNLQRFGYHEQPTAFVLTFSSALDPTPAENSHNYTLLTVLKNGHVGKTIAIVSAVYNPLTDPVTLHPLGGFISFNTISWW
jgi:hypothetical protein